MTTSNAAGVYEDGYGQPWAVELGQMWALNRTGRGLSPDEIAGTNGPLTRLVPLPGREALADAIDVDWHTAQSPLVVADRVFALLTGEVGR